jgi:hypothetical protein
MQRRTFLTRTAVGGAAALLMHGHSATPGSAQSVQRAPLNLLRNGSFQDDWLSLLPQNQTLHWAYANSIYNRRDFHPDGWTCTGNWQWLDADQPRGRRRLVIGGPKCLIAQRVHWFAVHDERNIAGFPDAGGFPELRPLYSRTPDRLVRDLTLRVRLRGDNVARNPGAIELGLAPLGAPETSDPLGSVVKPLVSQSSLIPSGTFDWQWIETRLPASAWLAAAAQLPVDPGKGPTPRLLLPPVVWIAIRFEGASGSVELGSAHLSEPGPGGPNLLPNGGFEAASADGYPAMWEAPAKYRYFPPKNYYLFNTWHNARFAIRGRVELDAVVAHGGGKSLKMIVTSGDELSVTSHPITLDQTEPWLIEVAACVKTDRLCMLEIDALDENDQRLDGFSFIHKAPVSIGTDEWRMVRQVFRPRRPVRSLRLMLCARGANGYTLDATGVQPHNNVVGTVWWDDVRVGEPESTPDELTKRGVKAVPETDGRSGPHLVDLDLGERLFGANELSARLLNVGPDATFALRWDVTSPTGQRATWATTPVRIAASAEHDIRLPYTLQEPCAAYTEYRSRLIILRNGQELAGTDLWFATWPVQIDLKLGALYLRPEQKQFVRLNLGLSASTMTQLASVKLELVERRSGAVLRSVDLPATVQAVRAQRNRIPTGLRGDLANLLLTDVDVSTLPVQPFQDPERRWLIRATALDRTGRTVATVESPPFCRQAHEPAQQAIRQVSVGADNMLRVNGEPWMPWGGIYGFAPAYPGPAEPGPQAYRDLRQLPAWSMYDGFTPEPYNRRENDFNTARDVAGAITPRETVEKRWTTDNLYSSTVFVTPGPVSSIAELRDKAGGEASLKAYLDFCKQPAMVVATAPGIEESFGLFHTMTEQQLAGLGAVVEHLRKATGKPVMVSHGGYWNRLEFEKVPYFDIYDPETEPLYPANLHTDLWPLIEGRSKVTWLRPQMYEDVPYERWRFHVYTELMRGCRGWQIAHGPGDASLVRGLHGELEFMKPILASSEPRPSIRIEPWMEHWSRRYNGRTYVIAATTHGLQFGRWKPDASGGTRSRLTEATADKSDESEPQPLLRAPAAEYAAHGIEHLPGSRAWPAGSRLVQAVQVDDAAAREGFAVLVKANGRFIHAAAWGPLDIGRLRGLPVSVWFLRTFYRHIVGVVGWDLAGLTAALQYIPERAVSMGPSPPAGKWVQIEVPLAKMGAHDKLIDGVAFLHRGGRIRWGRTAIVGPSGDEFEIWGDGADRSPERLARTRIGVDGLKSRTRVRVLFEDRELKAADGFFIDDFRGQDLYQRFGGGPTTGYGDTPVAVHIYEIG